MMPTQTSPSLNSDQVMPFMFEAHAVRALTVNGEPWFVAADVCEALGNSDTSNVVGRLDDDERGTHTVRTPSGPQQMLVINESGLYSLTLTSRKPEAKRFKKWVTAEVLPAIRKTGVYAPVTDPRTAALIESLVRFDALEQAQKRQEAETQRLLEHVQHLEDRIDTDTRYFTIVGWYNLRKESICKPDAAAAGKKASALSRQRGIAIGKVFDAQHGEINSYHRDVLTDLFGAIRQTTTPQVV